MKLQLCTLYDSNYLDKGLVLYDSLEKCCDKFVLYVLPMDKKCSEVLSDLNLKHMQILDYEDFEDSDLKRLKMERSRAEFCWTCTAKLIKYVIKKFDVDLCTYIDADLYFYENPEIIIQEMIDESASVQIIEHNFRKYERVESEKSAGKYCVEFNTFLNNEDGMNVLSSWEADCVNECSYGVNSEVMGDQKYLEKWPLRYRCVNVSKNQGAGVAPWNVNKFNYEKKATNHYVIKDEETKKKFSLVFFHFQNIIFIDKNEIYCCIVKKRIRPLITEIYSDYLDQIVKKKDLLYKCYGLDSMIKIHPADEGKDSSVSTKGRIISVKRLPHMIKSACLIMRAKILHWLYCRDEEELIVKVER